jgi:hypothetical protein
MINVPKKSSQAWFVLVLWERLSIYDPFSPVTVPHFPETAEGKKLGLPSHRSFADPANREVEACDSNSGSLGSRIQPEC